ncbi:hypothetical protein ABFY57_10095 [Paenibacillus polymyxa]|uniref:hypothetical protein n=1 Tax=Paenibacillus polymyxa TaxID=1406 RepID=UPI003D29C9FF
MSKLIIDKIHMRETPQTGTWLFCFEAKVGNNVAMYHIPNKEYEGVVFIEMGLEIPNVNNGDLVNFEIRLDDDEEDVCSFEAEDQCRNSFTANQAGSQNFDADEDWNFSVHWRLVD